MGGFMNIYQNVLSSDIQVWYNDIVIFVSVFWVKQKISGRFTNETLCKCKCRI